MTGARRTAAKRDANEPEIIEVLRSAGAQVWQLSEEGIPDLLVTKNGQTILMEVKMPKGKLTPAQEKFHAEWNGGSVFIVRSPEEALKAIGALYA